MGVHSKHSFCQKLLISQELSLNNGPVDLSLEHLISVAIVTYNLPYEKLNEMLSSGGGFRQGNGTPLQLSCLENPMDGGAWWAAVHGVARVRHD